jgi:hypothetical protein
MSVGPLNTLKQIRRIIIRTNDRDLTKLIFDLQKEYFALESEHLKLNAKFAKLEREMDLRRKMHMCPPSYYYFQDGDDVPYCPVCWESAKKAVHLRTQSHGDGGTRRECLVCKQRFWEKDNGKRAIAASRYWDLRPCQWLNRAQFSRSPIRPILILAARKKVTHFIEQPAASSGLSLKARQG